MTTTLSPAPFQKFFDNNGAPLSKGQLFVYSAGTTTKATTWTDSTGSVTNTNPIVLDYRGECNLWISPNVGYKYVLAPATDTDPPTNPIKTIDNIVNSQLITLYGGVDTGIANAYVLNFTANFSVYADGIIIYWIPSNTCGYGTCTINVNGLGIVQIFNPDGSVPYANQIIANQPCQILYKGGKFIFIGQNNKGTFVCQQQASNGLFSASAVGQVPFNTYLYNGPFAVTGPPFKFTAIATGVYYITSTVTVQNVGAGNGVLNAIYFSKNGATAIGANRVEFNLGPYSKGSTINTATLPFVVSGTTLLPLTAGDTIQVNIDLGAGWSANGCSTLIGSVFSGSRFE